MECSGGTTTHRSRPLDLAQTSAIQSLYAPHKAVSSSGSSVR